MGGYDDHVAIMGGDWMPPSPSPRSFFSAMLGEDVGFKSISDPTVENKNEEQILSENADEKNGAGGDQETNLAPLSEPKTRNCGGGLMERMAARAGFNAPRLNTENIRAAAADLSRNQEIQSPYLTIPPGLSPTTLLDSPVFLSNSLVQPSPTTGKFQFVPNGNCRSSMFMTEKDSFFDNINNSSFAFKPVAESNPSLSLGPVSKQFFPSIETPLQSENLLPQSIEPRKVYSENGPSLHLQPEFSRSSIEKETRDSNISSETRAFDTIGGSSEHSPPPVEQQVEDSNQRIAEDTVNVGSAASSEDGYNWRKYGQKQVKGSEYPRSYYKCTHPNCPVKKKVERSREGNITEIVYKGAHNHPKPPPNRRSSAVGSLNPLGDVQFDVPEQGGPGGDVDPVWPTIQKDWRRDNLEVTSSALGPEYSNASPGLQAQNGSQLESGDAVDRSSTFSNDEDEDECATHGSASVGCDGEGDESESKRRKIEAYATEVSGASRTIREPRVVVQTTSEVDILDDGYRWRKYGQKVVKGNPNPRSYYKCTNAGCTVRKHVERASHDLKSVITTYEGKHNHDVPAARNSGGHTNSGSSNGGPSQAAAQAQSHRPEPSSQIQNSMARFERPPHSLGSFGLPGRQQLGGPHHAFHFGMNQPGLASLAMAGLGGPSQGKLPGLPVHPYFGQARPMSEMGFMLPKGEPKVEPMNETVMNLGNGSSVYHQIMSRLPLGPQM